MSGQTSNTLDKETWINAKDLSAKDHKAVYNFLELISHINIDCDQLAKLYFQYVLPYFHADPERVFHNELFSSIVDGDIIVK